MIAGVLGVLAVLGLALSVVAVWAPRVVFDRDEVSRLAADAFAEPDVQAGLAMYVTDQVFSAVGVEDVIEQVAPGSITRFAPLLATGAQTAVQNALTRVIASDEGQQLLTVVVGRGHDRAMRLVRGDGLLDGVHVNEGEVSLNLLPLVSRGLLRLQQLGLLDRINVPTLTIDGDPAAQRAELSAALGRELPATFGQLVVYRSEAIADAQESVQNVQRMLVAAKRALVTLLIVTVVLVVATVLVAPRRWRAVLVLGMGVAAVMVLLRSAVRVAVDQVPDVATRPGGRAALDAIASGASSSLLRLAGVVLILGLVAAAVALFRLRWTRTDLVLVAAVAVGVAIVSVLGFGLWPVVAGLAVAVAVPFVARAILSPAAPAVSGHASA